MGRKRRHASESEKGQSSSPLKRSKCHTNVTTTTDGVSLTEIKTIKTIDDDGVRETVEYELWCKLHNPVSRHFPSDRSTHP
jgi:hypothetical protein